MMLGDRAIQALGGDVGVNFGRGYVGVAEHFLQAAQVGAMVEQVGCKGVAQHMGADFPRIEAGGNGQLFQHERKTLAGDVPFRRGPGGKQVMFGLSVPRGQKFGPQREPCRQSIARGGGKRHHALLVALAAHDQAPFIARHGSEREAHQLRDPQAGGVEHFQQRHHSDALAALNQAGLADECQNTVLVH